MMRTGNILCCVATTLLVLALAPVRANAGILGPRAEFAGQPAAQPAPPQASGAASEIPPTRADPVLTRPPIAPDKAMGLFDLLHTRVREWRLAPLPSDATPLEGVGAACVELRLDGVLLARASAEGADAFERAMNDAMRSADQKLPVPPDALRQQNARLAAERIIISLELAGTLVPTDLRTNAAVDATVSPGLDGVAVRVGERVGLVFPAEMLADGFVPSAGVGLAASRTGDASLSVLEPQMLRKDHGAVIYRFRTLHIATAAPSSAPIFLFRGGRVTPMTSIDQPAMERMATALAMHLVREAMGPLDAMRSVAEAPSMHPDAKSWDLFTKGLVARALAMQAARETDPGKRLAMRYASRALTEALATGKIDTPLAAASLINAKAAFIRASGDPPTDANLKVDALFANPAFRLDPATLASSPVAGWLALAAAEAGLRSPQRTDVAAEIVQATISRPDGPDLVALMPFLGEAELRIAANRRSFTPDADPALPHADAFIAMRDRLVASMANDPGAPDLDGGDVFAGSPYPTWHAARPAAFVAQMLGNPRLTPKEQVIPRLSQSLSVMRYLRQLSVDESNAWLYPDPASVEGGVRLSVWDPRVRPEPSAVSLIAVIRTLESLQTALPQSSKKAP